MNIVKKQYFVSQPKKGKTQLIAVLIPQNFSIGRSCLNLKICDHVLQ